MGRMIERVDSSPRSDSAKRSHGRAGQERMLIHSRILSDRYLGAKLRVAAEIKRRLDLRADNLGAGKEADLRVRVRSLTGCIFEKIDFDRRKLHAPPSLNRLRAKCIQSANES